jgi:4-amino-4-deoxy-L-arabinose transferase-like glycosyltransferase
MHSRDMLKKNKDLILVLLLTLAGAFLHFYNINWGSPFYFHPDERNIASAVSQLKFPEQMNPHFFAYGSLPIYTIYFTGIIANFFPAPQSLGHVVSPFTVSFDQAILISRFFSALFATLLIPILFVIGKKLKDKQTGLLAAFLATTSVGFIQFSHFGTFEMWLTFFSVLLFWLCFQKPNIKTVLFLGSVFGILVATKVSALALIILPSVALLFRGKVSHIKYFFLFLIITAAIYAFSNPYVFSDTKSFESSIRYETNVALGTLPVFYTGEFINTIPVLFQLQNVYPFLLNPFIALIFIPSFFYILYKSIKTKNFFFLLLLSYFLILLVSQAFVFVKWTRYMIPTLPFMYLMIAVTLSDITTANYSTMKFPHSLPMKIIFFICSLFSLSYFTTAFAQPDTRTTAQEFAKNNIPQNSHILSEVYDLGIVPFNNSFNNIELFNFYDLDSGNPTLASELSTKLANANYIILPSQRLLKIRLNNPEHFPNGNHFYESLLHDKLGYTLIYKTPCDIFCSITYWGDPIFRYEETTNVFDRPTVYIFKKINN